MNKAQRKNADRIVALADAFGHMPTGPHDQTVEGLLNLSIPCARLVRAGVVTRVADTNDGLTDVAVQEVERSCARAVAYATEQHGRGWWTERAEALLPPAVAYVTRAEDGTVQEIATADGHRVYGTEHPAEKPWTFADGS